MITFIVELTVDFDDDELISEEGVRKLFDSLDPSFGIVTVDSVQKEEKS
jgi:hypothetical protein